MTFQAMHNRRDPGILSNWREAVAEHARCPGKLSACLKGAVPDLAQNPIVFIGTRSELRLKLTKYSANFILCDGTVAGGWSSLRIQHFDASVVEAGVNAQVTTGRALVGAVGGFFHAPAPLPGALVPPSNGLGDRLRRANDRATHEVRIGLPFQNPGQISVLTLLPGVMAGYRPLAPTVAAFPALGGRPVLQIGPAIVPLL